MNKVVSSADDAVADIKSGSTIMLGGFGLCGIPENLIAALVRRRITGLHTISNNMGVDGFGMGLMLEAGMIASHVGSYVGENRRLETLVLKGELDLTLIPQGTLAERIRAGGAGIPAFYVPTGLGTIVAEGKETRKIGDRTYVLEQALHADVALIKAWKGDRLGNLVYRKTARNFNPAMATAADLTIAEVEELVEPGELDPAAHYYSGDLCESDPGGRGVSQADRVKVYPVGRCCVTGKERIARRIAREFKDGFYVNLGIGLPTMIAGYIPAGIDVMFQSENGMLGVGGHPTDEQADPDLINAGKQPVTELPGCSFFGSEESFAMIRGGHMDMSILGAMQVDEHGNLANWTIPGKMVKGMGGAMDLVAGARRVIVAMEHQTKEGAPRILKECTLPLTGQSVVHDIVTELCWIHVTPEGLVLTEIAEGLDAAAVQARTEAKLIVSPELRVMTVTAS